MTRRVVRLPDVMLGVVARELIHAIHSHRAAQAAAAFQAHVDDALDILDTDDEMVETATVTYGPSHPLYMVREP